MEEDIQNYLPTVMFVGHPVPNIILFTPRLVLEHLLGLVLFLGNKQGEKYKL